MLDTYSDKPNNQKYAKDHGDNLFKIVAINIWEYDASKYFFELKYSVLIERFIPTLYVRNQKPFNSIKSKGYVISRYGFNVFIENVIFDFLFKTVELENVVKEKETMGTKNILKIKYINKKDLTWQLREIIKDLESSNGIYGNLGKESTVIIHSEVSVGIENEYPEEDKESEGC